MGLTPRASKAAQYGPLISPARDRETPIYNWHAFKHSYSRDLVKGLAIEFGLKKGAWVLDPFCGGGTTLLACKELGINSEGFDILPFSAFLSNVKTRTYKTSELRRHLGKFYKQSESPQRNTNLPDIKIIREAFSPAVKKDLLRLKSQIATIRNPKIKDFYMLGLLSILESVSNTAKAGGFLRIEKKRISKGEVLKQFLHRVETMISDIEEFDDDSMPSDVEASAEISDSRSLKTKRKFDAVITSPPYPNRHDYTRIYGLELIVGFIKSNDELKRIRYNTLRSHVEARRQFQAAGYKKPKKIDPIISKIKKAGLNNPQVPKMIEGYFEDMYLSLLRMRQNLKKNGKIALVVSNVRFGGVNIPVDQILAQIGEQTGLSTNAVFTVRYRGNSAQQMGKFKRRPSRESIIVWENA
ncbi:MAG: hypothetical protein A2039_02820 [Candidatus Melainabacteria bacterium GWA2_34_9]|nr:MAG: hypothetical protein A2039_02820 [Candidatus Melainabacteria bacterium GWA2_34_9]OGX30546.1 MAG: hypothetical protein A2787_06965 [Omnitrophica WOR_2 bacterium RIFCSPHIGHO2_01_FULL_48_9]